MICSDTVEEREKALDKLEPMQQGDFEKLYEAMEGKHVNIRFLDPPLMNSFLQQKKILKKLQRHRVRQLNRLRLLLFLSTNLTL